ncbi:MAG: TatD family hydrolase [Muribaculaceae bacterium]|nr:TatD family hydrolase [Muribaculaceae bacterium]
MSQSTGHLLLDLHTHHPVPQPEAIVALDPAQLPAEGAYPCQVYSVGIHPWSLTGLTLPADRLEALRRAATRRDVVAIGETGIDTVHPGSAPMAGQLNAFRQHIELSEELRKPLVIHCVKGQDIVTGVRRDMHPVQPWAIHGFRGKPTVMRMFADLGIYISFGKQFNPDTLLQTPAELILAETDDTPGRIEDIIGALNAVRPDITPELLHANLLRLLGN